MQITEKMYARYLDRVRHYKQTRGKEVRMGQSYFNVLFMHFPDIADSIRATEFDPYYNDGVIPAFLSHLFTNHVAQCCRNCMGHSN